MSDKAIAFKINRAPTTPPMVQPNSDKVRCSSIIDAPQRCYGFQWKDLVKGAVPDRCWKVVVNVRVSHTPQFELSD
jgi:hypothetical protein